VYTVVDIEIFLLRKNIQDVCRPLGDCQTADWYRIIIGLYIGYRNSQCNYKTLYKHMNTKYILYIILYKYPCLLIHINTTLIQTLYIIHSVIRSGSKLR
jgi:hypothetical protein